MSKAGASKASPDDRQSSCLHCCVMDAIEDWSRANCPRVGDQVSLDVSHVIAKVSECLVETIMACPDRSSRRRAMKFAHDALDAAMVSYRTGKLVEVEITAEH